MTGSVIVIDCVHNDIHKDKSFSLILWGSGAPVYGAIWGLHLDDCFIVPPSLFSFTLKKPWLPTTWLYSHNFFFCFVCFLSSYRMIIDVLIIAVTISGVLVGIIHWPVGFRQSPYKNLVGATVFDNIWHAIITDGLISRWLSAVRNSQDSKYIDLSDSSRHSAGNNLFCSTWRWNASEDLLHAFRISPTWRKLIGHQS